jgi:hypothetical protein
MGISDNPRDAGQCSKFFWGSLSVAAGDDDFGGGVCGMELSNGIASLGISGGGDCTGVHDDDVRGCRIGGGGAAAVEQLAFDRGAIGLGGAATELLDEKCGHTELRNRKKMLNAEFTEYTEIAEKKGFLVTVKVNSDQNAS